MSDIVFQFYLKIHKIDLFSSKTINRAIYDSKMDACWRMLRNISNRASRPRKRKFTEFNFN